MKHINTLAILIGVSCSLSAFAANLPNDVISDFIIPSGLIKATSLSQPNATSIKNNQISLSDTTMNEFWRNYLNLAVSILREVATQAPSLKEKFPLTIAVSQHLDGDGLGQGQMISIGFDQFERFADIIRHEAGHLAYEAIKRSINRKLPPEFISYFLNLDPRFKDQKRYPQQEKEIEIYAGDFMSEIFGDAPVFAHNPRTFLPKRPINPDGIAFSLEAIKFVYDGGWQYDSHYISKLLYSLLTVFYRESSDPKIFDKWYSFIQAAVKKPESYRVCLFPFSDVMMVRFGMSLARVLDSFQESLSPEHAQLLGQIRVRLNATSKEIQFLETTVNQSVDCQFGQYLVP